MIKELAAEELCLSRSALGVSKMVQERERSRPQVVVLIQLYRSSIQHHQAVVGMSLVKKSWKTLKTTALRPFQMKMTMLS